MKQSSKFNLEDIKVQSFVTLLQDVDNQTLKGGSSMGTIHDHETCEEMFSKPYHYDDGNVDP